METSSIESEKYTITSHDTFVTFANEDTTVILKESGTTPDYKIKFSFDDSVDSTELKISAKNMEAPDTGTIFTFTGANNSLDAGIGEPFKFAQKTTTEGRNYDYYINVWVRKMGASRCITYTIYLSKSPTE